MKPITPYCWECGKRLRPVMYKRGVVFVRILGYDGNKHDVHKACVGSQFIIKDESP